MYLTLRDEIEKLYQDCWFDYTWLYPDGRFRGIMCTSGHCTIDGASFSAILRYFSTRDSLDFSGFYLYDLNRFRMQKANYLIKQLAFCEIWDEGQESNKSMHNLIVKICCHENMNSCIKRIEFTPYFISYKDYETVKGILTKLGVTFVNPKLQLYQKYLKELIKAKQLKRESDDLESSKDHF